MNNKYKKIKKNTVNYFVINGQNHLYIKDQVSVNFKPYNKTYHLFLFLENKEKILL
jgi:predicted class III extradiol MEMO1 family dioxygenase